MRLLLPSIAALCLLGAACGSKPPNVEDAGTGVTGTVPPRLQLGQGAGLPTVSGGGYSVTVNAGQPLVKEMSAPGGKTLQPGLMPQTRVK